MKRNWISNCCTVLEFLVLLGPTLGYSIYTYVSTLQYVLTETQEAGFWAVFGISLTSVIVGCVGYKRIKVLYDRYVSTYVQQKGDLEVHPDDKQLIERVADKQSVVEVVDYIMLTIPLILFTILLYLLQNVIDHVISILTVLCVSFMAKIAIHEFKIYIQKRSMIAKIPVDKV